MRVTIELPGNVVADLRRRKEVQEQMEDLRLEIRRLEDKLAELEVEKEDAESERDDLDDESTRLDESIRESIESVVEDIDLDALEIDEGNSENSYSSFSLGQRVRVEKNVDYTGNVLYSVAFGELGVISNLDPIDETVRVYLDNTSTYWFKPENLRHA